MLTLTPGRRFCLEQLAQREMTGREISKAAFDARIQRRSNAEWADKYLRPLREAGYIAHTGALRDASQVYEITQSGEIFFHGKTLEEAVPKDPLQEINLTSGRLFCLEALAEANLTGPQISIAAFKAKKVRRDTSEWADKYLAFLRKEGLIRKTENKYYGAFIHEITDNGRKKLEMMKEIT